MTSDLYYIYLGFVNIEPHVLFENPTTVEDVDKVYKTLAKKFHPDKHASSPEDSEWAGKIFALLGEYRENLKDLIEGGVELLVR